MLIAFGVLRVLGIKEVDWRGIRYRLSSSGGADAALHAVRGKMDPPGQSLNRGKRTLTESLNRIAD